MKGILVLCFAGLLMVATVQASFQNINSLRLLLRHLEETENEKEIQGLEKTNAVVDVEKNNPIKPQSQVKMEELEDLDNIKTDVVEKKPGKQKTLAEKKPGKQETLGDNKPGKQKTLVEKKPGKQKTLVKTEDETSARSHTAVDFHMISVSRHEIENYMWDIWHRLESAEEDINDVLEDIAGLQNTLPGEVEHHLEDILQSYQELGDHLDHYLLYDLNDLLIKIYIFGVEGHCLPDCMEDLANMGQIGVDHVVSLFDCILNVDANLLESWETAYQEMLAETVPQECVNFQAIADSHDLEGNCPGGVLQILPILMTNGLQCIQSGILALKEYMDINDNLNTILYQGSNVEVREYITTVIFHTHNVFDKAYDMADPVGVVIDCVYQEMTAGAGEANFISNSIPNSTKSLNPSNDNDKLKHALKRKALFAKNWSRNNYQKHMKGLYLRRGKY